MILIIISLTTIIITIIKFIKNREENYHEMDEI